MFPALFINLVKSSVVTCNLRVFSLKVEESDIEKMYRLGRWQDGKSRSLIVSFKNLEERQGDGRFEES